MNIIQSIIFGVVEGITEFLPISSTGHLILTAEFLGINQTDFVKSFEIAIQSGAILAVIVLYWKDLLGAQGVWKKVLAAFLPTAVIGLLLYKVLKSFLLGNSAIVLWALFLGGIALIVFELLHKDGDDAVATMSDISIPQAVLIGLFQAIAIIPGVSRSAATIVGGLCLGLKRKTIVEFSFLLAVPTMCVAMAYDLMKSSSSFNSGDILVLSVGFIVSFVVALAAIKFLLSFIKSHTFIPFGIYRIILAVAFWLSVK